MEDSKSLRIIGYIRIIVILLFLGIVGLYTGTYILRGDNNQQYFLMASLVLVGFSFLNLLHTREAKNEKWFFYTLALFLAMVCGSLGDFMMGGIIFLTPDALINGIIFFGLGHVFYLMGLRNKSPLLFKEGAGPIIRNLAILVLCVVGGGVLFYFTVFDPYDFALSIGALCYGVLLASVLAFALAKSFEEFRIGFKIVLSLGFFLFLFSDWVLGVRHFASSDFLESFLVGITYIVGQFLIHLSPILGESPETLESSAS